MRQMTLDVVLADRIKDYILLNDLQENDRIPSNRDLAESFQVQRLTVSSALKRLVNEGVLYALPRSGYYVAEKKIVRDLVKFESFTEMMQTKGLEVVTKCIHISITESNKNISQRLGIPLGTKLYEIKRVRIIEDKPFAVETSYIPEQYIPGIEQLDLETNSLYEILANEYHIQLSGACQEISMAFADEEDKDLLEVEEGEALFLLRSVAVNQQNEKIEYSKSLTRGDRCIFTNVLTKKEV